MWYEESVRHDYARQGVKTGRKINDLSHLSNNSSISLDRNEIRRLAAEVDYLSAELHRPELSEGRRQEIVERLTSLDNEINNLATADAQTDDAQTRADYGYVKDSLQKMKEVAEKGIEAIESGAEKAWQWEKEHWPKQKELAKKIGKEIEKGREKVVEYEKENWPAQKQFIKEVVTIPPGVDVAADEYRKGMTSRNQDTGIFDIPTFRDTEYQDSNDYVGNEKVRIKIPTEVDVTVRGDKSKVQIIQAQQPKQPGFLSGLLDF